MSDCFKARDVLGASQGDIFYWDGPGDPAPGPRKWFGGLDQLEAIADKDVPQDTLLSRWVQTWTDPIPAPGAWVCTYYDDVGLVGLAFCTKDEAQRELSQLRTGYGVNFDPRATPGEIIRVPIPDTSAGDAVEP